MDVPMELSRILITELGDQQVIFLREKDGERSFPIVIGTNEALAINRRLKGQETPRPMTHDLLASVIEYMGGQLDRIVIDDIRDHTFIATLYIIQDEQTLAIDSRPSDAIALGAAFNTPIFVAEHVLDVVVNAPASKSDRLELLRQRLEVLRQSMEEINKRLNNEAFLAQAGTEVVEDVRKQLEEITSEYEAIDHVLKKLG